jgi:phospholipase/carboxylesterase
MELIHALYEPAGKGPHPTILTLHGRGANALDLLGLAPYLGAGRFLVICPQGPLETPIGPEATGYAWYPMSKGGSPDVEEILTSRQRLQQFLDGCLARYPIDSQKLAVLGFSQGGVMAYSLALANPEHFAALVALSSWLPPELLRELSLGDSARFLPILIQHGTEDSMIEVERARHSVEIVRQAGLPVTYREYQMGHEIRPKSLSDLSAWLEENVLSPVAISK